MKITKNRLRSIIQEELTRALNEQDANALRKAQLDKDAKAAAGRAVATVQDMWNFMTGEEEAGGEEEAIKLMKKAAKGVGSNIGQAILKMFKEGEGQLQEGLLDFFTGSTINTLKQMGKKLVRDLRRMAVADSDGSGGDLEARMETALNAALKQAGIPSRAQSALRALIASVGTI